MTDDQKVSAAIGGRSPEQARMMRVVTVAALAVTLFIITLKVWALWLTGGAALTGSMMDSALDLLISLINLIAVRKSLVPPDEDHRFGHEKAEAIAGILQTVLLGASALFLLVESGAAIVAPAAIDRPIVGIAVSGVALVLTLGLVASQTYVIRRTKSVAIEADSLHYKGDLLLNASVIASLAAGAWLGWHIVDGFAGITIALYIANGAIGIFSRSLDILMDKELATDQRNQILKIARQHPRVVNLHDVRTRSSGNRIFIQMHLELDERMNLREAHDITDAVEALICKDFPTADVMIHKDPVTLYPQVESRVLH